jgi:WD40 repeat protein
MNRTHRFLIDSFYLTLGAICACSSVDAPRPVASSPSFIARTNESGTPSLNIAEPQEPPTSAPLVIAVPNESPKEVTVASPATKGILLEADTNFLYAPLPIPAQGRYKSWKPAGLIYVGKGGFTTLEFLGNEQSLVTFSDDETALRIYDTKTKGLRSTWSPAELPKGDRFAFLPWNKSDASKFLIEKRDGLWLYDPSTRNVPKQLTDFSFSDFGWSRDEHYLVTVQSDIPTQTSVVRIFQRQNDDPLRFVGELPKTERVDAWDLSRNNRYLARVFYPTNHVSIVDLQTEQTVFDAPIPEYVNSVEFSPDGQFLAVGGNGLKVFNLNQPERRAEYTYLYNNISDIEYSPSGDAIAVSSYDGHVRLLSYSAEENRLTLLQAFRHEGRANVYKVRFFDQGNALVSSSGDQSIRFFRGDKVPPTKANTAKTVWSAPKLGQTSAHRNAISVEPTQPPNRESAVYSPKRLLEAPLPSRILPGKYACKITKIYKLRDCWVERDARGHTLLEFAKDNLLGVRGVLYDDGPLVRFEGWLTEAGNLGCSNCAAQPIFAVLRGSGSRYQGLLQYRGHFDPLAPPEPPPQNVLFEEAIDRFPIVLERRE